MISADVNNFGVNGIDGQRINVLQFRIIRSGDALPRMRIVRRAIRAGTRARYPHAGIGFGTLEGTNGTSALTQHTRGGKVTSRTIAVHTIDGSRRLTLSELVATTLHELGHIWCCFGPGTSGGHWTYAPAGFSAVGLMYSPMRCDVPAGGDPVCPSVFSDRELAQMGLNGP